MLYTPRMGAVEKRQEVHESSYFPVPREVIDGVLLNNSLRGQFADPFMEEMLMDTEWIIDHFAFFSFGTLTNDPQATNRLNTPSGFRSFVGLQFMEPVVIGGYAYGELNGKGTGIITLFDEDEAKRADENDPWGIFGLEEAYADLFKSKINAELGARGSRFLAAIKLNREKFIAWLRENQDKFPPYYNPIEQVEKVPEGESLAIMVRFTQPRYADIEIAKYTKFPPEHPYSVENIFDSDKRGIRAEILARNPDPLIALEGYMHDHNMTGELASKFREILDWISNSSMEYVITQKEIADLCLLEAYLTGFYSGRYTKNFPPDQPAELPFNTSPQDRGIGAFVNDFEGRFWTQLTLQDSFAVFNQVIMRYLGGHLKIDTEPLEEMVKAGFTQGMIA